MFNNIALHNKIKAIVSIYVKSPVPIYSQNVQKLQIIAIP